MTAIWGWTFVLVKDAIRHYPTLPFLQIRFALALLVMAAIVRRPPSRRMLQIGFVVGLALAAGYLFQTLGLKYTSPGNAGLITGLFVVFTPLIDRVFGTTVHARTVVAAAAALIGTVALSGFGSTSVEPLGDGLEVLCALCFALHLVLLSRWSPGLASAPLAMVQMGTATLVFSVGAVTTFRIPQGTSLLLAITITGVFASALAFFIQTWAQSKLSASRTALILATEPAWALFFGVLLAGQRFTILQGLGALLLLAAILGHEIAAARGESREPGAQTAAAQPEPQ